MILEPANEVYIRDHVYRKDAPPITLYFFGLQESSQPATDHKLRCLFCAFPFFETRNDVAYVVFDEGHLDNKTSSGTVVCKRCKQRYHITV